jgi:hypothetical protein
LQPEKIQRGYTQAWWKKLTESRLSGARTRWFDA